MTNNVTLEQVEQLAMQLPAAEQLKLLASISTQLSDSAIVAPLVDEEADRKAREAQAEALLQEWDAIADSIEGEFDSVATIQELREERIARL